MDHCFLGALSNDDPDDGEFETVADDTYHDACQARSDLLEIGLPDMSPWAAGHVYRAAGHLFHAYRAARSAADFGRPGSADRLREARLRLREEAWNLLAGFPGCDAGARGQP